MSSASLAVVPRAHPDSVRIAALSAAIALNLAALLVALRPAAPQWLQAVHVGQAPMVRLIEPPPPAPPPPPIELKALPPRAAPMPHAVVAPPPPPVAVSSDEGQQAAPPANPPLTTADTSSGVSNSGAPIEASLAYRMAPLRFPALALRQHMQGTVLLRVLVDETGKPIDVQIARSSGHALLDRSAREQVLAGWRFRPAIVQGHAVRACAQVPVEFALNEL